MVSPQLASKIMTGMFAFYGVSLNFTDFSLKNYGETNDMARLWYKWNGVSFLWSFIPYVILALKNQKDDAKLRRMLTFMAFGTFLNVGMMVAGGPKSAGGLFVDSEHRTNIIMQTLMIPLLGTAISNGPVATRKGDVMSTPIKKALALNAAAFIFWYIDFATLSPVTKYCTGCDISDPYTYDAMVRRCHPTGSELDDVHYQHRGCRGPEDHRHLVRRHALHHRVHYPLQPPRVRDPRRRRHGGNNSARRTPRVPCLGPSERRRHEGQKQIKKQDIS